MPKNKFQDVIFTIIMATIMVYGMVVYNVALNTGGVSGETFLAALHELPIMVPIAFVLEFFVIGKIAKILAFTVMRPNDRPQFITYAISICICCNHFIQGHKNIWNMDSDMGNEFSNGNLLSDVLLWSACKTNF